MLSSAVRWSLLGVVALTLSAACKKPADDEGGTSGVASAAPASTPPPATSVAADPIPGASGSAAAPPAEASAAPPDSPNPADTGAPPVREREVRGPSIEACCAALAAYRHSGRPAGVKQKAVRAAGICHGIADTVRSGRSTRAQGLAQIRSLLGGSAAPPECN